LCIFRKCIEKIQVWLKSDKNNEYYTWRSMYIYDNITLIFLIMGNFSDWICREIKTHILCSITSLFFNFLILHFWENMEEYGRAIQSTDYNIIWRMRFACCVTKATNRHSEYLILIALLLQKWLHECASVLSYNCIACLVVCLVLKITANNWFFRTHTNIHFDSTRKLFTSANW